MQLQLYSSSIHTKRANRVAVFEGSPIRYNIALKGTGVIIILTSSYHLGFPDIIFHMLFVRVMEILFRRSHSTVISGAK